MTFDIIPKLKNWHQRRSSTPINAMQASGNAISAALDSYNNVRANNIYILPSLGVTQTTEQMRVADALQLVLDQVPNVKVETPLRSTELAESSGYDMNSIYEEEESPDTPTIASPMTTRDILQNHKRNASTSVGVVHASERMVEDGSRNPQNTILYDDNRAKRYPSSAKTSQYSTDDCPYKLSKLLSKDLKFSEPVENHVITYMTSKKDFSWNPRYAICLWHPFSSIDLDIQVQEKHCICGDVGRFNSRGGFDVMFNIFMTMEENRQMDYFPPTTFTPCQKRLLISPQEENSFFKTADVVCDKKQTIYGTYSFQSVKRPEPPGSAILVAPGCAVTEFSATARHHLRRYLHNQVDSWYDPNNYPNGQHEGLTSGTLKLICTSYRSKVWAAAALPQSSINKIFEGQPKARLSRSVDSADAYVWDPVDPLFNVNHGSSKGDVSRNIEYTVAIEVYSLGLLDTQAPSILDRVKSHLRSGAGIFTTSALYRSMH